MFNDIVPLGVLRQGFEFSGTRVSFGSFMKGIHRAKEQVGPAALTLLTAQDGPYDDFDDVDGGVVHYRYRAGDPDQPDNRALRAAYELQTPLIYFRGVGDGQYAVIAPVFVVSDDPAAGVVQLETGLPYVDVQGAGLVSSEGARREQFAMVARRLDQVKFRRDVLRVYRGRCAVCSLKERELVEAAHIIGWREPDGVAAVVNGLALCAIHHRAYDRNLMGIDPDGVVHIGHRLLAEIDGPMLKTGLQGFHGADILQPRQVEDRPDPDRLRVRFEAFEAVA
ncbi:MAG: putative restriction endonuclease [Solirubrobacterales bacterium]|nr:putative restriction endonuclease [Solirubrobacterales bacterium]